MQPESRVKIEQAIELIGDGSTSKAMFILEDVLEREEEVRGSGLQTSDEVSISVGGSS